jgi:hypothetical protein
VGVSPFTVKGWVRRKQLHPLKPRANPLLFREHDVAECAHARMSKARHRRLDRSFAQPDLFR